MSDGIAEMNNQQGKVTTTYETGGLVYLLVKGSGCNGCSFSPGEDECAAAPDCSGHVFKLSTPLDKASSDLLAKGTPLVADVRTFDTGATRDTDEGKPRFHAYSCPLVDQSFGNYMLKHQKQSDGTMRPADNWKKRMPLEEILESLIRHVKDLELHHDGYADQCREKDIHEVLNGCKANINFYHHGIIQDELEIPKLNNCNNCHWFQGRNFKKAGCPCFICGDGSEHDQWEPIKKT